MVKKVPPYQSRLQKVQRRLEVKQAALISNPIDIFYLTGFPQLSPTEREAFLLIGINETILFHHSFSPTLPTQPWLTRVPNTNINQLALQLKNYQKVFIDERTLTLVEWKNLKKLVAGKFTPLNHHWLEQLRISKDRFEQVQLHQAGQIAARVFDQIRQTLEAGVTEQALARQILTEILKEHKATGLAFPTIVAFGPNAALPHYQPKATKLVPETPVLIDFGVNVGGYFSDMTRTFWFGEKPAAKFLEVEQAVQAAYDQALAKLQNRHEGLTAKDLDEAARGVITKRGYGDQFIHTTGHGLGLEIHEPPSLSWNNSTPIIPDMTITIEPGIYLPGEFGYRHENTVLTTKKSAKILTTHQA